MKNINLNNPKNAARTLYVSFPNKAKEIFDNNNNNNNNSNKNKNKKITKNHQQNIITEIIKTITTTTTTTLLPEELSVGNKFSVLLINDKAPPTTNQWR